VIDNYKADDDARGRTQGTKVRKRTGLRAEKSPVAAELEAVSAQTENAVKTA
jgi:hypothetical protein